MEGVVRRLVKQWSIEVSNVLIDRVHNFAPGFDCYTQDMQGYESGPLRRLVLLVRCLMREQLRSYVHFSSRKWVEFLRGYSEPEVGKTAGPPLLMQPDADLDPVDAVIGRSDEALGLPDDGAAARVEEAEGLAADAAQ